MVLRGLALVLTTTLAAHAHAAPPPPPPLPILATAALPLDDSRLRGVSLADLDDPRAARVLAALTRDDPGRFEAFTAAALVEVGASAMTVDLVGRARRFAGLGVVRVTVPLGPTGEPGPAAVVWERAFSAMHPTLDVSLGDEVAVLEDLALGFRRVWPVGIGAADSIRRPGRLASLTPTTDSGRLSKKGSLARLGGWGRGLPYMPMHLPMFGHRKNGEVRKWFYETRVAFHAWPGQSFIRGYVSRGCVVLRDEDLGELYGVVMALPDDLAFSTHVASTADAWHPWPYASDVFWRLQDFGKPGKPSYRVAGNLYVIEKVTAEPPPDRLALVDIYSDAEARQVVAMLTGRGCGPVPVPLRMSDGDRCVPERALIGY